jgi:hypothetical protein
MLWRGVRKHWCIEEDDFEISNGPHVGMRFARAAGDERETQMLQRRWIFAKWIGKCCAIRRQDEWANVF